MISQILKNKHNDKFAWRDYKPSKKCRRNLDCEEDICFKCESCGRKFKNGKLIKE